MRQFFIARQPILDGAGDTVAYELLFRSSDHNAYDPKVDGDAATSQVLINAVQELGLNKIVGRKLAFVNLTNRFLEQPELVEHLPKERVVLEVLETIDVNPQVIEGVKSLRASQYRIALDDFQDTEDFAALKPLACLIKYDISQYTMDELCEIAGNKPDGVRLLAERVETLDQFNILQQAGFDLFQGYYFSKPEILSGKKIPSSKGLLLHLLSQINNTAISLEEISTLLARDVSLSVRALKYVNSPLNGLLQEVTSVKQAAVLLGRNTIRQWVTLLLVADINDKPVELVHMALTRARFCQLCAQKQPQINEHICFTAGLLSLVDAMMDIELEQVLDNISATQELRDILLNQTGPEGALLKTVHCIENAQAAPPDFELTEAMNDTYYEALDWAEQASGLIGH